MVLSSGLTVLQICPLAGFCAMADRLVYILENWKRVKQLEKRAAMGATRSNAAHFGRESIRDAMDEREAMRICASKIKLQQQSILILGSPFLSPVLHTRPLT
eukprot:TRINITY_DN12673_c0_g1_i1.p3 TRINITY_DN12673_c0_g1~~TRINITY_DN12673_c0_g1_i1.p3  ORF type:complete len:102 (-),score=14.00 TRINITY_DN12673_c0_g1_i1:15-320(-)